MAPKLLEVRTEMSAPWDAGSSLPGMLRGRAGCTGVQGHGTRSRWPETAALPRQPRSTCLAAAEVPREPVPTGGDRGDQAAGRHGHGHQGRDAVPIHLPRPPASSREDGVKGKVAPYP